MDAEITASHGISRQEADEARSLFESLERHAGRPLTGGRLTLRHIGAAADNSHVADASVLFDGRLFAAHRGGPPASRRRPTPSSSGYAGNCAGPRIPRSPGARIAPRSPTQSRRWSQIPTSDRRRG